MPTTYKNLIIPTFPKFIPTKIGVQIARLIAGGDVTAARNLRACAGSSWSVAEARAIIGACKIWGVDPQGILFP